MSKKLIIAEKPSVGRDIARVLKCTKKGDGIIEGGDYIITWALGHLVELAPPEKYNEKFKTWNMIDLPIIPSELKLEVIKKTSKQYHAVKKQLNRNDVSEIVIATDAGREGELVARWILEMSHCKKPIKRLWISSVTDRAIQEGFRQLKDGRNYDNLYHSALARAQSDWIVGINATRALTCKYNAQLSCGRVQTPTLNLIAHRENEIKAFVPKTFHEIKLTAGKISFLWKDSKTSEGRIFDEIKLNKLLELCKASLQAKVVSVEKKEKSIYPPTLYDLTELQRDANRLFDFSAKETLSIAQRLYENHKVLTYPRTDSKYISSDIVATVKDRLEAIKVGEYLPLVKKVGIIKAQKHFVDNSKVSDHHALIPTEQKVSLGLLSDSEQKIFDLVVKRFLSVLYPPYRYEQVTIKVELSNEVFTATGKHPLSLGWKEIYTKDRDLLLDEDKEILLPQAKINELLTIQEIKSVESKTTPPPLFNEGTLLSAMENPSKYMSKKDSQLAQILGESGGLGTVATRADIIEKIFNKFYVEKRGKDIITTSKGRQLLELVPEDLKAPDLTATWEQKLNEIKNGKLKRNDFINEIKIYTKEIIVEIQKDDAKFIHDNISGEKCSICGKHMLQEKDKVGAVLVCTDRACGNRKRLSKITNARCPNCKKKLTMVGQGEGQLFTCTCGHREKLTSFNQRKSKETKGISKKEAQQYLKKNNKDQPEMNSALADALSKLKF